MHEKSPSKIWRMQTFKYKLLGSFCGKCKKKHFPFKSICPSCKLSENIREYLFKPHGQVISWTQIYSAPSGFEKYVPYLVALVKLDEGPVLLSQICDCNPKDLKIGFPVEAIFRRLILPDGAGVIKYGLKFRSANW